MNQFLKLTIWFYFLKICWGSCPPSWHLGGPRPALPLKAWHYYCQYHNPRILHFQLPHGMNLDLRIWNTPANTDPCAGLHFFTIQKITCLWFNLDTLFLFSKVWLNPFYWNIVKVVFFNPISYKDFSDPILYRLFPYTCEFLVYQILSRSFK